MWQQILKISQKKAPSTLQLTIRVQHTEHMLKRQTSCRFENNTAVVHRARRRGFTWRILQMEQVILRLRNLRYRLRHQQASRSQQVMSRRRVIRLVFRLHLLIQPIRRHLVQSKSRADYKDRLAIETRRISARRTLVEVDRTVRVQVNNEVKTRPIRISHKPYRKILTNLRWYNRSIAQDLTCNSIQQLNRLTNSTTANHWSLRPKYSNNFKAWLKITKSTSIKTQTPKRWFRLCANFLSKCQIRTVTCQPPTIVRRTSTS